MKVLIITDIHSDYVAAESAYHSESPDFVLDCGDHEEIKNLFEFVPHFYIHGNHEPMTITPPKDCMPIPHKISPGQIINLEKNNRRIRVAGLDGNYASPEKQLSITDFSLRGLWSIPEGSIDILLTHESPLLVPLRSPYYRIASEVISEIDRIKPQYVFSGHGGGYNNNLETDGKVKNIVLDEMARGYGILDGETLAFTRKKVRFR